MKVQAVVFGIAIAFLASFAHVEAKYAPFSVTNDVVLFVEGFGYGIGQTFGNVTLCSKDANTTLDNFAKGFSDLKQGFARLSVSYVERGLLEWAAGLADLAPLLENCGAVTLAEDIGRLVAKIQEGQVFEVVISEVVNIFFNGKTLIRDFDQAIFAWEKADYFTSGAATGRIVAILLED
eukprot:TRINITY_DN1880_c0_g1_i1.p1 TRINITY_DN1880_c0_g1~~TRINITY_DN1880_c0_g1_i1.p1  ORF type:complete len:196 (-),score=36.49 TRINITY_DN1880_c0_g1_i1:97-633(-)